MAFITFEGVEGCGKSTQMELLKAFFEKMGKEVLTVREPGGTRIGEKVRAILLNSGEEPIDPWAELFMYEACRAQLVKNIIRP
ncbi:MAG: dTMP kinase, partial [Deltaproteobacteria bacterium]|nr:dTMP kinase [Deltaproteobacteria bacterium]